MKNTFLYTILICVIVFSCKKNGGHKHLTGRILENISNHIIEGAKVTLAEKIVNFGGPNTQNSLQTVLSGADGTYSFDFDMDNSKNYIVVATKDQYMDNGNNQTSVSHKGSKPVCNVTIQPYAYLKLRLVGDLNTANACKFSLGEGVKYANQYQGLDSTYFGVLEGNVNYELMYFLYDNSAKEIKRDKIVVKVDAKDTLDYKFEF